MEFIAPLIGFLGFFTLLGWVVYVVVDGRRRRERLKLVTEFHGKLLDRIGSARELGEFLHTEGGGRFLDTLSVDRPGSGPKERIIRAAQTGIVLLALGLALLLLGAKNDKGFMILGTIVLSVGVGFLGSAGASYLLSRSFGLLNGRHDEPRQGVAGRESQPL